MVRDLAEAFRQDIVTGVGEAQLRERAEALYDHLVRPVRGFLRESKLVINAEGALAQIPFAALRDANSGKYLVEDFALVMVPSVNSYISCVRRARALRRSGESLKLWCLKACKKMRVGLESQAPLGEARAIAALYSGATLINGSKATKSTFWNLVKVSDIVHFAGHGAADKIAPLWSYLLLDSTADGRLFAHQIYRKRLSRPRLVVLSGCSTSDGKMTISEGAESMARAFL